MKKSILVLLSFFMVVIFAANAQDKNEFKPSGKPEALIFTNFSNTSTGENSQNKFEITRVYLGYSYNFTPVWSGRAVLDVGNPGVGSYQYTAFLKNAYVQYMNPKLTVKFGMISTTAYDVQEKMWGNRYILKSFQDQYGMNPSADLGISAAYKISNFLSLDAILVNGDGYKINDADSVLKVGVGVTLHPLAALTIRGYYDNMPKGSANQQTSAVMVGYSDKKLSIAGEYNYQTDYKLKKGQDWSGYSAYGTYHFTSKVGFIARYDKLSSVKISSAANE